ncbi:MAG: hypothetical protein WBV94_05590 [Blastocatellia bacterium]
MPNPYATGSIAEVDQQVGGEDVRLVILDGARFVNARAVNNRTSASGNLYTQTQMLTAGIPFGVRLDFADIDLLNDTITAIKAAIDAQEPFPVELEDDFHSIAADCVPDGSNWLQYPDGRITGNQVKAVVMRFLTA